MNRTNTSMDSDKESSILRKKSYDLEKLLEQKEAEVHSWQEKYFSLGKSFTNLEEDYIKQIKMSEELDGELNSLVKKYKTLEKQNVELENDNVAKSEIIDELIQINGSHMAEMEN